MFPLKRQGELGVVYVPTLGLAFWLLQNEINKSPRLWAYLLWLLLLAFGKLDFLAGRNRLFGHCNASAAHHLGVLPLDLPPQFIRLLPNAFLSHQLTSHGCEHVIILIETLQTVVGELPFHGYTELVGRDHAVNRDVLELTLCAYYVPPFNIKSER